MWRQPDQIHFHAAHSVLKPGCGLHRREKSRSVPLLAEVAWFFAPKMFLCFIFLSGAKFSWDEQTSECLAVVLVPTFDDNKGLVCCHGSGDFPCSGGCERGIKQADIEV